MALFTQVPDNVSLCLQHLKTVDELLVKMKIEFWQTFHYVIKNNGGEKLYEVVEEDDCCSRCGKTSLFALNVLDNSGNEVIHLSRRKIYHTIRSCLPFCRRVKIAMDVCSPPGTLIGVVEEIQSSDLEFDIKNENGDVVLKIEGPWDIGLGERRGSKFDFKVLTIDKSMVVGKITKQSGGIWRESCAKAYQFKLLFPFDLDVRMKATLIGACILLDFMFLLHSH